MARIFLTDLDLQQNQVISVVIHNAETAPSTPVEGQMYYNPTGKQLYVYADGEWKPLIGSVFEGVANGVATLNANSLVVQNPANAQVLPAADKIVLANGSGKIDNGWLNTGSGNGIDVDKLDGQEGTYYVDRNHHTGTQLAVTISDFDTQVRTSAINQLAIATANVNINNNNIINLAMPSASHHAASKQYVDNVIQGLSAKKSVKAATTANVNIDAGAAGWG